MSHGTIDYHSTLVSRTGRNAARAGGAARRDRTTPIPRNRRAALASALRDSLRNRVWLPRGKPSKDSRGSGQIQRRTLDDKDASNTRTNGLLLSRTCNTRPTTPRVSRSEQDMERELTARSPRTLLGRKEGRRHARARRTHPSKRSWYTRHTLTYGALQRPNERS